MSLKGSSGMMMYNNITTISHKLEDIFFFLRESHPDNVPHVQLVEHVLEVADFITGELDKIENGDEADGDASEIIAGLDKFLNGLKGISDGEEKEEEQEDEIKILLEKHVEAFGRNYENHEKQR